MMKVQKSKLIKIIRDRRQMKLRSNTHGCELTRKTASWTSAAIIETLMTVTISEVIRKIPI